MSIIIEREPQTVAEMEVAGMKAGIAIAKAVRGAVNMRTQQAQTSRPTRKSSTVARRKRHSDAARKPVLHVVMPGCEVARAEPKPRETISAFLRRTGWARKDRQYGWQFRKGLPTVLEINGEAVLRKAWRTTRIAANDVVRFVSYPLGGQGGGAKQVIGLVALVAVAAFAAWAPVGILGLAQGSFGALASTAAIGVAGVSLVNILERNCHVGD